jgi:hypothetical protein
MKKVFNPFHFVLIALAGWMSHRQYQLISYRREENRVLREQLAERRLRLNAAWPSEPHLWGTG